MSSWTALNVAYNDEYEQPDVEFPPFSVSEHPEEGFDLLLYTFETAYGEQVDAITRQLWNITPTKNNVEEIVAVSGSDTSDSFTFLQLEPGSLRVKRKWSNTEVTDHGVAYERSGVLDRIEYDIGRRPSFGGNYR